MYIVVDFYENPDGEIICSSKNLEYCKDFIYKFIEDTDGECNLKIFKEVRNKNEKG